jgi:glutamate-ammonia-ligase adenylyltransferase
LRGTTAALSDVADTILQRVVELVEPAVRIRYGEPEAAGRNPPAGAVGADDACPYVLLGLGKLGGREISYHSDLDLLLVYAADGTTTRGEANRLYFTELVQRVIRTTSRMGPMGRLYEVDMRLRPTGKSGSLVLPLSEFRRYFAGPGCQLWERQALARARAVCGAGPFAEEVMAAARAAMLGPAWDPRVVEEVRAMRQRLEATAGPRSLKRGPGGLADVEFAVQLLQLKYGRDRPAVLAPNVWDALDALSAGGALPSAEAAVLRDGYTFLRLVEARLRIVTDRALTDIPDAAEDQAKLAHRLGFADTGAFLTELRRTAAGVRTCYDAVVAREK